MKLSDIVIEDRKIDPIKLATRVANKYGNRTKYGYFDPPVKGKNIPLKSFNASKVDKVENQYFLSRKIDPDNWFGKFVKKEIPIKGLVATQPFVRTDDVIQLQSKINDRSPDNICVATYKGKNYIMDGHHTIVAAWLRGDKSIIAKYIDLDTFDYNS